MKNVSVYIPDDLEEKLAAYPEINVSEICRRALEDYVKGRKRSDNALQDVEKLRIRIELIEAYLHKAEETNK